MAASVILIAALLTKNSIVPTFEKTGGSFRSLSFETGRFLFAIHEDQFAIIFNQYAFKG